MSSQVILITGASTGFGRRTAEDLAGRGHTVYATMRGVEGKNKEHADALLAKAAESDWNLKVRELDDVSDTSVGDAIGGIIADEGRLDVIVNNAGQAPAGILETYPTEQLHQLFDVNVYGPHRVLRAALTQLRKQKSGLIVNITSTVGRIAFPFLAAYNASKFALEALGEGYREELASKGIDVVHIQPGAFPTEIFGKMAQGKDESRLGDYGSELESMNQLFGGLGEALEADDAPNPQLVVDAIREVIDGEPGKRQFRVTVGTTGTAGVRELNADYDKHKATAMQAMGIA